jgi:hypothetical protein
LENFFLPITEPRKERGIDPEEDAIGIERIIAARSIVIEVAKLVRGPA